MGLKLTPEMLIASYELLRTTPPFRGYKLPHPDEIEFRIMDDPDCNGYYLFDKRHIIGIHKNISTLHVLNVKMAHEMVHLYQEIKGLNTDNGNESYEATHNEDFHKRARRVCHYHKFDPGDFA